MKKGKLKNCKKGYACGGGCISVKYACKKNFPEGVSVPLNHLAGKLAKEVDKAMQDTDSKLKAMKDTTAKAKTSKAGGLAKEVDKAMQDTDSKLKALKDSITKAKTSKVGELAKEVDKAMQNTDSKLKTMKDTAKVSPEKADEQIKNSAKSLGDKLSKANEKDDFDNANKLLNDFESNLKKSNASPAVKEQMGKAIKFEREKVQVQKQRKIDTEVSDSSKAEVKNIKQAIDNGDKSVTKKITALKKKIDKSDATDSMKSKMKELVENQERRLKEEIVKYIENTLNWQI